jgi:hypothetical protein
VPDLRLERCTTGRRVAEDGLDRAGLHRVVEGSRGGVRADQADARWGARGVGEGRAGGAREAAAGAVGRGDVNRVGRGAEACDAQENRGAARAILPDEGEDGRALAERHAVAAHPERARPRGVVARSASKPGDGR